MVEEFVKLLFLVRLIKLNTNFFVNLKCENTSLKVLSGENWYTWHTVHKYEMN